MQFCAIFNTMRDFWICIALIRRSFLRSPVCDSLLTVDEKKRLFCLPKIAIDSIESFIKFARDVSIMVKLKVLIINH